jgi:NAD(P)-dependent dehydrogenase (short-subunit alcohol dehydrogenase family)
MSPRTIQRILAALPWMGEGYPKIASGSSQLSRRFAYTRSASTHPKRDGETAMGEARFDFAGQTVFVAGGSSGINLGIAKGFARAGAKVAILGRDRAKAESAVAELERLTRQAICFAADVRDGEAVAAALAAARQQLGEIDVLVSGAAGNFAAPALGISPNGFKSVVDIDLLGTFHVLRAGFPHLRKPGVSILNISAPQAEQPMMLQAHVCAAKAGVDMLTRVLAMEWGPLGVRVNAISPGPIADTEGMRRLAPTPAAVARTAASVPLGRCGEADEIAQAALFLSSAQASYINGAILAVDGGWALAGASMMSLALAQGAPVAGA